MSKTLYYLGHFADIASVFEDFVDRCVMVKEHHPVPTMTKDDVLVFGGGTDINPVLYGAKKSRHTHCHAWNQNSRDHHELDAYHQARREGAMMLGICRGSQFLAAVAGHALYQDVSGHGNNHHIKAKPDTVDLSLFPEESLCISTHHQMVRKKDTSPNPMEVLYISSPTLTKAAVITDDEIVIPKEDPDFEEIEIYTVPNLKILGIQGHPEYAPNSHPFTDLSRKLFQHYQQEWSK